MCNQSELNKITSSMRSYIADVFPNEHIEMILFGSYARGEQTEGSDIDLLFLVDSSRADIARRNWQIGDVVAELLCEYGIVVAPIVENRKYFYDNERVLPLFRNIRREGVVLSV